MFSSLDSKYYTHTLYRDAIQSKLRLRYTRTKSVGLYISLKRMFSASSQAPLESIHNIPEPPPLRRSSACLILSGPGGSGLGPTASAEPVLIFSSCSPPSTQPSRSSSKKIHNFGKRSNSIKRNLNAPVVKSSWLHKQVGSRTTSTPPRTDYHSEPP